MERRFFNLTIDVYVPGRWYFKTPTTPDGQTVEDPWVFTSGKPIEPPGRLLIPLSRQGKPLDFTSAGVGLTPVVSARVAAVFREMAPNDVQLFPVEVEGQTEPFHLLIAARQIRCIDDAACEEVRLWTPEDGRPDRVGEYYVISGLRIDKSKVGDARVFRLWGYHVALIVDGELKAALERTGIVGGRFVEV
ncbi:imm11 family protein [Pyxidicoccus sp. 3LG]